MKRIKYVLIAALMISATCVSFACRKNKNHVHTYGKWEVVTPATCTEAGEEKRVCSANSAHVEKREITALGHDWVWTTETVATCGVAGLENAVCSRDSSHTDSRTTPATVHDFDDRGACEICGAVLGSNPSLAIELTLGLAAASADITLSYETYYSFTPAADGYYEFVSESEYISEFGAKLYTADDLEHELIGIRGNGNDGNFRLVAPLSAAQTYYLMAMERDYLADTYSVTVNALAPATAKTLNPGTPEKAGTVKDARFSFTAPADGTYKLERSGGTFESWLIIFTYDKDGTLIGSDYFNPEYSDSRSLLLKKSESVYIIAYNSDGVYDEESAYYIAINSKTVVVIDTENSGEAGLMPHMWFKFTAAESGVYGIFAENDPQLDADVEAWAAIINSDGIEMFEVEINSRWDERAEIALFAGETVYIDVWNGVDNYGQDYAFDVKIVALNAKVLTAENPVTTGEEFRSWLKFTAATAGIYTLTTDATRLDGIYLFASVYTAGFGGEGIGGPANLGHTIKFMMKAGETVYIHLYNSKGNYGEDYLYEVEISGEPVASGIKGGASRDTAVAIPADGNILGGADETGYFKFTAETGFYRIIYDMEVGDPYFEVLNSAGRILPVARYSSMHVLLTAGEYFLKIFYGMDTVINLAIEKVVCGELGVNSPVIAGEEAETWLTLTADADGLYKIFTNNDPDKGEYYSAQVLDAKHGKWLAHSRIDAGYGNYLGLSMKAGETVYIIAYNNDGDYGEGNYFAVELEFMDDSGAVAGGSWGNPTDLTEGTSEMFYGEGITISYFTFTVETPGFYRIASELTMGDPLAKLYNANGDFIADNDDWGGSRDFHIVYFLASGEYRLEIGFYIYTLYTVSIEQLTAEAISVDAPLDGGAGPETCVVFTAESDGVYGLTADTGGKDDLYVYAMVFDADGTLINDGTVDSENGECLQFSLKAGNSVYFLTNDVDYGFGDGYHYTLSVQYFGAVVSGGADNASAVTVQSGDMLAGTEDETAYFKFMVSAAGYYGIVSDLVYGDPSATLYTETGEYLESDDDGKDGRNFSIEYFLTAGNYILEIYCYENSLYTLEIEELTAEIVPGTPMDAGENFLTYFRLTADLKGAYLLSSDNDFHVTDMNVRAWIYNADGDGILSGVIDSGDEPIVMSLSAGETVYITITGNESPYTVSVEYRDAASGGIEKDSPEDLPLGGLIVGEMGERGFFIFEVQSVGYYSIASNLVYGDPYAYLYTAEGDYIIGSNNRDDGTRNFQILCFLKTGEYILELLHDYASLYTVEIEDVTTEIVPDIPMDAGMTRWIYFLLTADADGAYILTADNGGNENIAVYIEVYDSDGDIITGSNVGSAPEEGIHLVLRAGDAVYLGTNNSYHDPESPEPYTVSVEYYDAVIGGADKDSAAELQSGDMIAAYINDRVCFKFTVSTTGYYSISSNLLYGNPAASLFAAENIWLADNDDYDIFSYNFRIDCFLPAGEYILDISHLENSLYTVDIEDMTAEIVSGNPMDAGEESYTYFRLTADADGTYVFTADNGGNENITVFVEAYDFEGNFIAGRNVGSEVSEGLQLTLNAGDTVCIMTTNTLEFYGELYHYTVSVERFEKGIIGGADMDSAVEVQDGDLLAGIASSTAYYKFTVSADGYYRIESDRVYGYPYAYLYTESGNQLAGNGDGSNFRIGQFLTADSNYILGMQYNRNTLFRLSIGEGADELVHGVQTEVPADEWTYFRLTADADGFYLLTAENDPVKTGINVYAQLFRPDGTWISGSNINSDIGESLSIYLNDGETVYIEVWDDRTAAREGYRFTLDVKYYDMGGAEVGGADESEAVSLSIDTPVQIVGTAGDTAYFGFSVAAEGFYTVDAYLYFGSSWANVCLSGGAVFAGGGIGVGGNSDFTVFLSARNYLLEMSYYQDSLFSLTIGQTQMGELGGVAGEKSETWFVLNMETTGTYRIFSKDAPSDVLPSCNIYNGSGLSIAGDNMKFSDGTWAIIDLEADTPVYIKVYNALNNYGSEYRFTLECEFMGSSGMMYGGADLSSAVALPDSDIMLCIEAETSSFFKFSVESSGFYEIATEAVSGAVEADLLSGTLVLSKGDGYGYYILAYLTAGEHNIKVTSGASTRFGIKVNAMPDAAAISEETSGTAGGAMFDLFSFTAPETGLYKIYADKLPDGMNTDAFTVVCDGAGGLIEHGAIYSDMSDYITVSLIEGGGVYVATLKGGYPFTEAYLYALKVKSIDTDLAVAGGGADSPKELADTSVMLSCGFDEASYFKFTAAKSGLYTLQFETLIGAASAELYQGEISIAVDNSGHRTYSMVAALEGGTEYVLKMMCDIDTLISLNIVQPEINTLTVGVPADAGTEREIWFSFDALADARYALVSFNTSGSRFVDVYVELFGPSGDCITGGALNAAASNVIIFSADIDLSLYLRVTNIGEAYGENYPFEIFLISE